MSSDLMTLEKATAWLSNARGRILGIDTETNGEDIRDGRGYAIGVSLAFLGPAGYSRAYFPLRHEGPGNLPHRVIEDLRTTIEAAPMAVFHNAKFDLEVLRTLGINYLGRDWYCTMVISSLINENWPKSKALDSVAPAYLGEEFHKRKSPEMDGIIKAFGWKYVPVFMMDEYASWDAELALRLMAALFEKFMAEGLDKYWPHKRRLIETVMEMEALGVEVDTDLCELMLKQAEHEMSVHSAALGGLNPRSPKDMKELLIDKMRLPPQYNPETGNITFDKNAMAVYEEILERLQSPEAKHILAYRGWGHASSNFYRAYLEHLSPDGRLRPSYIHHKDEADGGTVTGRLSCRNPNLQQIPRVTNKPWNGQVKKAFRATPGYRLWEADYSQLELRLAACYAKDENMARIFNEDRDVFTEMSQALNMTRYDTKTMVYTMQYGGGIPVLMRRFNVTETEARKRKQHYFETYPNFRTLAEIAQAKAKSRGNIRIWSGRYRHFQNRKTEAHKALNSAIQGGAADVVERRMSALRDQLVDGDNFRMLLQVHDSVISEVKIGMEKEILPEWQRIMMNVREDNEAFNVKFAVDIHPFGGE